MDAKATYNQLIQDAIFARVGARPHVGINNRRANILDDRLYTVRYSPVIIDISEPDGGIPRAGKFVECPDFEFTVTDFYHQEMGFPHDEFVRQAAEHFVRAATD